MFDPVDEEKREEERLLRTMRRAVGGAARPSPTKAQAPSASSLPMPSPAKPQASPAKPQAPAAAPSSPASQQPPAIVSEGSAGKKSWRELQAAQEANRAAEERRRLTDIAEQRLLDEQARQEREQRERIQDQYWSQAAAGVLQRGASPVNDDDILSKLLGAAASLESSSSSSQPQRSGSASSSVSALAPLQSSAPEVSQLEARVHARAAEEARQKEGELAALTAEKRELEAQRQQLRKPARLSTMEERTAWVALIARLLAQLVSGYTSAKNTRLVEAVSSLRDALTEIVDHFEQLDRGVSGKGQQLVAAASRLIQATVALAEAASRVPLHAQLRDSGELDGVRAACTQLVVEVLTQVKGLNQAHAGLQSRSAQSHAAAHVAGAVREAGLRLEQAVQMMALEERQFRPEAFAEQMAQIGLLVKNEVISVLDPVAHAESRAKLINALGELLLQAKSYKDSRSITSRTLVTAALTNLMSIMATLVMI